MFTDIQLRQLEFCFFQAGRLAASFKGKGKLWPLVHVLRLSCGSCAANLLPASYCEMADAICLHPGHDTDIWFRPIWRRGLAPWFHWLDVSPDGFTLA